MLEILQHHDHDLPITNQVDILLPSRKCFIKYLFTLVSLYHCARAQSRAQFKLLRLSAPVSSWISIMNIQFTKMICTTLDTSIRPSENKISHSSIELIVQYEYKWVSNKKMRHESSIGDLNEMKEIIDIDCTRGLYIRVQFFRMIEMLSSHSHSVLCT